jgi:hypothetical protein
MVDQYAGHAQGFDAPSAHGFSVTLSDSVDFAEPTRALYVGSGGDISVVMLSGAVLTLANVMSGALLPVRVKRVNAAGTTAAQIVGLV